MNPYDIALVVFLILIAVCASFIALKPNGRWVYLSNRQRICTSCGQVQRLVDGAYLLHGAIMPRNRNCRHDNP